MFKKLNSKLGLTLLVVIALLIVSVGYILTTSNSGSIKSARQNSSGKLVESDDVVIERAGNWTVQESTSASGGNYLYSSGSPDDVLTLTFVGSRVEVVYTTGANLGTLAIDVDHTVLRTVISANQSTKYQQNTVVDYLDDGVHILRLYAQKGGAIGIDAFRVSRSNQEAVVVDSSKVRSQVIESAQSEERICVMVGVDDTDIPSRGELPDVDMVRQRRAEVVATVKAGKIYGITDYSTISGFGASMDLNAVLELQTNPLVLDITKCVEYTRQLDSSLQHIGVPQTRNAYGLTGRNEFI